MMSVRYSTDILITGMQKLDIIFSARRSYTYTPNSSRRGAWKWSLQAKTKLCYLLIFHNKTEGELLCYPKSFNVCSAGVFEQLDFYPK
jgi:hypothetical protein